MRRRFGSSAAVVVDQSFVGFAGVGTQLWVLADFDFAQALDGSTNPKIRRYEVIIACRMLRLYDLEVNKA